MLLLFDIYGSPFSFTTYNKNFFKTNLGGFLGIITIVALAFLIYYLGQDLFNKSNPKISSYNIIQPKYSFENTSSKNMVIAWTIEFSNSSVVQFEDKLYPVLTYNEIDFTHNSSDIKRQSNLIFMKCDPKTIDISYSQSQNFSNFYCLDFGANNLSFGGYWGSQKIQYFKLGLYYCPRGLNYSENNGCSNLDELSTILNSGNSWSVSMYYPYYFFDYSSLKNPLKITYQKYLYKLNLGIKKVDSFFFNKIMLLDDQGALTNQTQINTIYPITQQNSDFNYLNFSNFEVENEVSLLYECNFYYNKDYLKYVRSFMKLQDLAGSIGGIINIIMKLFFMINYFYSLHKRDNFLFNEMFAFSRLKEDPIRKVTKNFTNNKNKTYAVIKKKSNFEDIEIIEKKIPIKRKIETREAIETLEKNSKNKSEDEIHFNKLQEFSLIKKSDIAFDKDSEYDKFYIKYQNYKNSVKKYSFSLFFVFRLKFCCKFVAEREKEKARIYQLCVNFLGERLDIIFYLKSLQTIDKIKTVFMNRNQKLSFEFFKKFNLFDKKDFDYIEKNFNHDPKRDLKKVIEYYKGKELNRFQDQKIIGCLDEIIRKEINKNVKRRNSF